ncbi:MAG: hypothetical protein JWP95_1347 [Actinotalea sp.]|nr:hypothetical protein [Actinotalea sp.]
MAIDDDAVLTYRALRDLDLLYDGYRAAARAHARVLRQMGAGLAERDAEDPDPGTAALRLRLRQRFDLAHETDLVCELRSEQVRRRMAEVRRKAGP